MNGRIQKTKRVNAKDLKKQIICPKELEGTGRKIKYEQKKKII